MNGVKPEYEEFWEMNFKIQEKIQRTVMKRKQSQSLGKRNQFYLMKMIY